MPNRKRSFTPQRILIFNVWIQSSFVNSTSHSDKRVSGYSLCQIDKLQAGKGNQPLLSIDELSCIWNVVINVLYHEIKLL